MARRYYLTLAGLLIVVLLTAGCTFFSAGIQNGGFESGDDGSWAWSSDNGWNPINNAGTRRLGAYEGEWMAWLGGPEGTDTYISQAIHVRPAAPILKFYFYLSSSETNEFEDLACVRVNGNPVHSWILNIANSTSEWTYCAVDLSAYAGQDVTLRFEIDNDSDNNSNLFLDAISMGM